MQILNNPQIAKTLLAHLVPLVYRQLNAGPGVDVAFPPTAPAGVDVRHWASVPRQN